jgi:hypothetical protein
MFGSSPLHHIFTLLELSTHFTKLLTFYQLNLISPPIILPVYR